MNKKLRTILTGKPFKLAVGLVIGLTTAYFLLGYFAVNPIAQRVLPWVAENKLASRMAVAQVKFDPLRFILTVDKLQLSRPDGGTLAGFEHLQVDLEADGLFRRAWHLKDIRLSAPYGHLDVGPDGRLNWAELLAKLDEDKEPDDDRIPRLLIDHLLIERGNLEYTERNRPTPFKAELAPLALELDGFSTLPQDRGDYLISAKMPDQGATLRWKGTFGANPLTSTGSVEIQGLRLAKLMEVVRRETLPMTFTQGEMGTRFNYAFAMVDGEAEPYPQAKLDAIAIQIAHLAGELGTESKVTLAEASATLPSLDLALHQGGRIHIQGLNAAAKQLALTQQSGHLLKLDEAAANGIDYDLAHNQLNIAEILLTQGEINATRAKDGSMDWQRLVPPGQPETIAATAPPPAEAQPFRFAIASVQLQGWKAAYEDQTFVHPLRAEIQDINLGLNVQEAENGIAIAALNSELASLTLRSALYPQPVASLAKISVTDGAVSLKDSTVKLPGIRLSGMQTQVLVDAKSNINWRAVLESVPLPAATAPADKNTTPGWKINLDTFTLDNSTVHIEDKSSGASVALDVQSAMLEVRDASLDLATPVPIKASFQFKQGGKFEAAGKMALAPLKGDMQIKLSGLPLKPFSPYLSRYTLLKLTDGHAGLRGKLSLKSEKTLSGRFAGGFNIDNLAITEEADERLFLGWKAVSSDSLRLALAPDKLHMDELRVVHPVGKIIIYEDKTMNVQRIMRPQPAASTPTSPAAAKDPNAPEKFPVTVDRVSVDNGDLEFADLSLVPQFGAHMHTLGGVINGLSTDAASTAQVELDGKVDEYGSARIRGSIQPFRATDFTDLTLAFRNLEMNRLTPYSGKFAGRKIDSGKLSVDLEYKIKNRQLTGENKFVINTLKLGERVESPDAVDLPLDLAIALLEDSNGIIDLDLPISGSLDDPQFSYGKIVWKAIVNVIGKIATAPFRALGKLLGISAEKLEAVAFDPGSAALAPPEQEKLKALADAMSKRPSLALRISPAFDAASDKAALQETATRRDVLKEMGLPLREGEQPGPLDLNNVKVQTAVENLLKDRTGEKRNIKALDAVRDYFKKPKPEDVPKYETMLQQLKATANVTDADLAALARARAAAIQGYLVDKGGLDAGRVSAQEPGKTTGDGKTVPVKMELGVAKSGNP
ncbi:MAG TPA: DUF748 domain-containing protein [Methylophilaceae bacterium]|nr:DUF748 domain-containing protein [Methylophilaceae bacterium]